MRTQGQAAVEFLTTYGFAFLVLLVTLGVISYTGIFNFSDLQSDECNFPSGLACMDFVLSKADIGAGFCGVNPLAAGEKPAVRAIVYNSYGVNITFTNITMTVDKVPGTVSACCMQTPGAPSNNLAAGQNRTIWCPVPEANYVGDQRYKAVMEFNFTQQGGSYNHSVKGSLSLHSQ